LALSLHCVVTSLVRPTASASNLIAAPLLNDAESFVDAVEALHDEG
jgi:hypothetical protein